jgi:hypothetical protein
MILAHARIGIMKSNKTSSRRDVLRAVVLSALVSAAPLSGLKAATKGDVPSLITLADGSLLIIQKIGGVGRSPPHYRATRQVGDKVVDENRPARLRGRMAK